jgi:hypothetical protein
LYSSLGTLLQVALPRFVATSMLLAALFLLGYTVARYQVVIHRRISLQDLPLSFATMVVLVALYVLLGMRIGLSQLQMAWIALLAVFTHSIYDLAHQLIQELFARQERRRWGEIRRLARGATTQEGLASSLRRGLAIICQNLQASGGFIALLSGEQATVAASLHSFAAGTTLPGAHLVSEELMQPSGEVGEKAEWLAPAFAGGKQVAAVAVGPRLGNREYSEEDLFWLEDFADQVGAMALIGQGDTQARRFAQDTRDQMEKMFNTLAYKPDTELVSVVEDCLRNLNDYIKLGGSPLVEMLEITGKTNIDRGKAVKDRLVTTLEMLRPAGQTPREPLPREWHSYVILHDAYVNDVPDRDIMGRLYVSEGTFYRARRKALHGVSKALLELGAPV